MRLIIILDEKISSIQITVNDVVLTNNFQYYANNNDVGIMTKLVDYSLVDENNEPAEAINKMFTSIGTDYKNYRNTLYMRIFRPMFSIIKQIEKLIKEMNINELTLIGGSEHLFLTINSAEGEGEKWWYKSSWFYNTIINQYFKETIKINWLNKENKRKIALINYIRDRMILFNGILKILYRSISNIRRSAPIYNFQNKKTPTISIINLSLQYEHLNSLLTRIKNIESLFVIPYRMVINNKSNIVRNYPIQLKYLLRFIYSECNLKKLEQKQVNFLLFNKNIPISTSSLRQSLKLLHLQFCIKTKELTILLGQIKLPNHAYLITDMTFGDDIILCNNVAKKHKIQHYNFQYVAMSKMLFPQIDLADKYYLYSKRTFDLYKIYSNTYKYYLPIKIHPKEHISSSSENLKIVIFTQPDEYSARYLNFIEKLFNRIQSENLKIDIIIKPHYRQDRMAEFEYYVSKFNFSKLATKDESCEKLILIADLCLSMTSSVIFEALMLGKMTGIINLDDQDQDFIYNNDTCFPEINFVVKSIEEVLTIIKQYHDYLSSFKLRYNQLLEKHNAIPDYEEIFALNKAV